MEALAAQYAVGPDGQAGDSRPYLIIGEEDHTQAFAQCLTQTGYTSPEWLGTEQQELRDKQAAAEATVQWAKCARQNGYPDLQDPAPPQADGWTTRPVAVLPAATTVGALQALLAACPNFDVAAHKAQADAIGALPDDATEAEREAVRQQFPAADPEIGFDYPGWDGLAPAEQDPQINPADQERLAALNQTLLAASQAFWENELQIVDGQYVG
jgi:hypothetical protein